jgi:hypothetical protein
MAITGFVQSTPLRLLCSDDEPSKSPASKARPVNREVDSCRADPPSSRPSFRKPAVAANSIKLNSWPAVQCNEGFCNALKGWGLIFHGVADPSSFKQFPHRAERSISGL